MVNKEYAHAKWDKQLKDKANAVPVSAIQKMIEYEPAKEAIWDTTISYHEKPTENMFLSIRDFLVARLGIENCQQPGPLESATEFQRSKEVDSKIVISVSCHKTSQAAPAPITMCANTHTKVKTYVKYIRRHKTQMSYLLPGKEVPSNQGRRCL